MLFRTDAKIGPDNAGTGAQKRLLHYSRWRGTLLCLYNFLQSMLLKWSLKLTSEDPLFDAVEQVIKKKCLLQKPNKKAFYITDCLSGNEGVVGHCVVVGTV